MAATARQIRAGEIRRRNAAAAGARKRAIAPKKVVAPKVPKQPAAPKPPPLPYAEYPLWARKQLMALDADQKHHQDYVGNTVIPGISGGLGNLQGYIDTAQNQYTAQLQGAAQGAYNVAAGATPMSVSGGPGGIVASPNAYQAQASSELSRSLGSAATAIGQHQAMLGKIGPATMSQGVLSNLAEYAKGLPLVYSQRRDERRGKIDEFMAEMAQAQAELMEKERSNRVNEAIRATNAESNAAIAFGRFGLDTEEFAADRADSQTAAGAPAPYGYQRDPATGKLVRDPSIPTASAPDSTAPAGNKPLSAASISSMNGSWKRPKSSPPKLGPGWKQPVWDPGTKKWYAKRAGSAAGAKPPKVVPYGTLVNDLGKLFNGKTDAFGAGTPGWSETFRGDQEGLRDAMADWVVDNRGGFNTKGGKFDPQKLLRALSTLGDGNKKFALIWPVLKARLKNGVLV
jgi:hypothetical protein